MKRVVVAEAVGTALLLAAVVGSGIMADRLSGGNEALALLANSFATAAALLALIAAFGPVSGAHFNPVVTLASVLERGTDRAEFIPRLAGQFAGAVAGVVAAHWMFAVATIQLSTRGRGGAAQWWSELVATFGLVVVIHATHKRPHIVPAVVAAYIAAAYWFTASTSFANPAVTLARAFTNTFHRDPPWRCHPVHAVPARRRRRRELSLSLALRGGPMKQRVLFLCTHNSSRSQMAEALLRLDHGDRFDSFSAGTEVTRVHPRAIEAMNELGADMSDHRSKHVDELLSEQFDIVITVCDSANETCPVFPAGTKRLHWSFPDPSKSGTLEEYRTVRDAIRTRLAEL